MKQEVKEIKDLFLARTGILLEKYIDDYANSWPQTPKGFRFIASDEKTRNFELTLIASNKIAYDIWFKNLRKTREYREVSKKDSLHIILRPGNPYEPWNKARVRYHWEVHLDTVAVCREAVRSRYGMVCGQIDLYYGAKHLSKDYFKWP